MLNFREILALKLPLGIVRVPGPPARLLGVCGSNWESEGPSGPRHHPWAVVDSGLCAQLAVSQVPCEERRPWGASYCCPRHDEEADGWPRLGGLAARLAPSDPSTLRRGT